MTAEFVPCPACAADAHEQCTEGLCSCVVDHPQDDAFMRDFKRLKRATPEERLRLLRGGAS